MNKKYIVITRPLAESKNLQKQLKRLGFKTLIYPTIEIQKNLLTEEAKKHLAHISSFHWIVFTSQNGVRFFVETLRELDIDPAILQKKYIAVVGPKTAEEVKKHQLPVHFIPSKFTTEHLANELQNIQGKKILLPRANIATPKLTEQLEKRGAHVTNIPIYNTKLTEIHNKEFEKLLETNQILCITFTSSSTVKGFLKNIEDMHMDTVIFSLPVVSIGPVTTKFLKQSGFQNVYMADTFTIEGMFTKLKENIL